MYSKWFTFLSMANFKGTKASALSCPNRSSLSRSSEVTQHLAHICACVQQDFPVQLVYYLLQTHLTGTMNHHSLRLYKNQCTVYIFLYIKRVQLKLQHLAFKSHFLTRSCVQNELLEPVSNKANASRE